MFFLQCPSSSSSCSHTPIPIGRPSSYPPSSKGTPQVSDVSPLSLSTTPPEVSCIALYCSRKYPHSPHVRLIGLDHPLPPHPNLPRNSILALYFPLNVLALVSPHSLGISNDILELLITNALVSCALTKKLIICIHGAGL